MGDDFNDVWRLDVASVSWRMSGACLWVEDVGSLSVCWTITVQSVLGNLIEV